MSTSSFLFDIYTSLEHLMRCCRQTHGVSQKSGQRHSGVSQKIGQVHSPKRCVILCANGYLNISKIISTLLKSSS